MASRRLQTRLAGLVAAAAALHVAAPLPAAPGFITASHVRRGSAIAEVTFRFRCDVQYIGHDPDGRGDQLRIRLESTGICHGASPSVARSREQHRPAAADEAKLVAVEYDGESPGSQQLRLSFSEELRFFVAPGRAGGNELTVRVFLPPETVPQAVPVVAAPGGRRVPRNASPGPGFVINLESRTRPPATGDLPDLEQADGQELLVSQAVIDGTTWYRVRLGHFATAEAAARELARIRQRFPGAWIDRAGAAAPLTVPALPDDPGPDRAAPPETEASATGDDVPGDEIEALMQDARRAMTAGELPRAVQIYTKVLRQPPSPLHPEAQEFLALARERNGQIAHAKAEYERYLAVYPDGEGADRVRQRLATLLATSGAPAAAPVGGGGAKSRDGGSSPWKFRSYFSQYYRRDVNQINDEDEVVSQSSVYSDLNLDARRRGERFDFTARLTAGYRTDLLDQERSSGNDMRVSYAYADLVDSRTGLRGRLGRQTRNTGGVLGRFDGFNLGYALNDRLRFDAVAGRPVYSTAHSPESARTFYGLSSNFGPAGGNLDLGVFALQQQFEGMTDRQSVGAELRYFGEDRSLWGVADYDTAFGKLGSAFLQGSMRLPSRLTLTGLVDHRRSPFLMLGNALVGQTMQSLEELALLFSEDELRQLALDRSAASTTVTLGLSQPVSTRVQVNLNASQSAIGGTPDSGGVTGTSATTYRYYTGNLVASSLFTEGDVGIFGLRYTESDATRIYSVNLDARFPVGRALRISPRLRVAYRRINADESTQWTYTPGLRLQYRWGRRVRLEFEAGREFSTREMAVADVDRESYFVNLGYQVFY